MKAKGKIVVHVLTVTVLVCLLALSSTAYAAPAAAQKSTVQQSTPQQTQSVIGVAPARMKYDPNAPPKGTITFTTSSKGNVNASTVLPGTYQYIQWTCNGTYSNLVDVTLWQNNKQVVVISKGIASGQTGYTVPIQMAAGNYEVRITSQGDPRVEARKAVLISASITVTKPVQNEVLKMESNYEATWSYVGNPGPVIVSYENENGCKRIIARSDQPSANSPKIVMANGQGKVTWTVQPIDDCYSSNPKTSNYHLFVKSTGTPQVSASSGLFSIPCKYAICGRWQVCTDLQTNYKNCGKCDNECNWYAGYTSCVNGKCKCGDPERTDCPGKYNNSCVSLKTDANNCGSCGKKCDPLSVTPDCINGVCTCGPPSYHAICLSITTPGVVKCVAVQFDVKNCGKCYNVCPNDKRFCESGECTNRDPYAPPADPSATIPKPWGF